MAIKNKPAEKAVQEPMFSKDSLVSCERFYKRRDLLSALLDDGKEYTIAEVEKMIDDYMKGKVK